MTLEEVDGQMVEKVETKIIAKDGTITKVPGKFKSYETSDEETEEQPRRLKKKLREMKWTRTLSLLPVASQCGKRTIEMIMAMHLILAHGVPNSCHVLSCLAFFWRLEPY
ncbi:hypothetical protein Tco_1001766 [Tanacetum coccineum]